MPPSRRPTAIRDTSDMVDDNAVHASPERIHTDFGPPKVHLKQEEFNALQDKAAQADHFQQIIEQLQSRGGDLLVQDNAIMVQGFQFTPTGLIAPDHIEKEAWKQVGALLLRLEGSIQWLIGDWLVYGEDVKWGDAKDIASQLGYEPATIHSYASVCRAVKPLIRIKELSFAHHRLVMKRSKAEQAKFLAFAAQEDMSVATFRKWLSADQPTLSSGDSPMREEFYSTYMPEANRFLFGVERIEELPVEHRKDAALRAQWLADYYSDLSKQLRGGKK